MENQETQSQPANNPSSDTHKQSQGQLSTKQTTNESHTTSATKDKLHKKKLVYLLTLLSIALFLLASVVIANAGWPRSPGNEWPPLVTLSTESWKEYTTDNLIDVDTLVPPFTSQQPSGYLTFKYPQTWKVIKGEHITMSGDFKGRPIQNILLTLQNQEYIANPGSHNSAIIRMMYARVPEGTEAFDKAFWQNLVPDIERKEQKEINGIKATFGYPQAGISLPLGVIYQISPTEQIYAYSEYKNFDRPFCIDNACKQTISELVQILSTFKFTE